MERTMTARGLLLVCASLLTTGCPSRPKPTPGPGDQGKRLGVTVTSAAQGEALIASLRQTMPDEAPRLFCYDVSGVQDLRKIALDATP